MLSFLRDAGLQPIPEAQIEIGERPDLRLSLAIFLELSVTHPTAPSELRVHRSSRALGAARQREYEKRQKYAELAVCENADFIPLVVESTGALG